MRMLLLIPALLMLAAAGCQRAAEDYVSVNGKVFVFNIRYATAFYMLTLNRLSAMPDNAVVIAEFENPAGGAALIREQKVFPKMTRIDLQSPDVDCVVTDRPYQIHITVRSPEGETLQTLDTTLTSTLDSSLLPAHALVEGPAYQRTKAAYSPDGGIRPRKKCG